MLDFLSQKMKAIGEPSAAVKVLKFVREKGTTSQTEIARSCQLSKAAVSEVVQRLLADGYLQEVGMSSSTSSGGRRRVLLKFNSLSGLVIGVDVKISSATLALSDLDATILSKREIKFPKGATPPDVIPMLVKAAHEILLAKPQSSGSLIGIGIGIPGIIDYSTGTLVVADTLKGWDGVSITQMFESHFGCAAYVENDVKSMTIAEYLLGIARGVQNCVLLWVGSGVGAGIMVDGRLLRGVTSSAGEIGYNDLGFSVGNGSNFPLLYNGQKDFGDLLSEDSIVDAYVRAAGNKIAEPPSFETILDLGSKGDVVAENIFREMGRVVGIMSIMLANTLNPELIVLGGSVIDSNPQVLREVSEFMSRDILPTPVQSVRIEPAHYKADEVLLGAIGLILYELFEPAMPLMIMKQRPRKVSEPRATRVLGQGV